MGKLGDIMGEEFEESYEEKRNRGGSAEKVGKETLMEIAYEAINNGGFDDEEPRFRFDAGKLDHDVLLMESPERDLQKFRHELGDDAMTLGMFHLDTLFSCAFQENMLDLLDKIEEGEYYLVVGKYQEKTQTDGSGGEKTYYNINPVRGIIPLDVAKKYADKYEDEMGGSSIEEQSQAQKSESSSSDDDDVDLGGIGDSEDQIDRGKIIKVFKHISNEAEDLLRGVVSGDSDSIDKLVQVTNNNLENSADRERILDIFEEEIEEIEGRGEEDDDDGIDLGGIDDDGSDSSSDDSEDTTDTDDSGSDDGDSSESMSEDDSDDVGDWFS